MKKSNYWPIYTRRESVATSLQILSFAPFSFFLFIHSLSCLFFLIPSSFSSSNKHTKQLFPLAVLTETSCNILRACKLCSRSLPTTTRSLLPKQVFPSLASCAEIPGKQCFRNNVSYFSQAIRHPKTLILTKR